jgi:hypothetical protein
MKTVFENANESMSVAENDIREPLKIPSPSGRGLG